MYTSVRDKPIPFSSFSSSLPAWPTNGTPFASSWNPGASPTNIRSACGSPEPKTTCVRVAASGQRVQPRVSSRYWASVSLTGRSLGAWPDASAAAAAAAAAAAGAAAEAGLGRRAADRERRHLLQHVPRTALRTGDRLLGAPDELLEVRLALHARVLVHR